MADFDAQIKESQEQVAQAQAKISTITSRIEMARSKLAAGESALDIETATLDDVKSHTDLMNANIAELIMGLDDVTAGFSEEFAEMRSKPGGRALWASSPPPAQIRCVRNGCGRLRSMTNCRI